MGLLINLYNFYLCVLIVMYGVIKIYAVQIYATCADSHNPHKSHAEICHFMVVYLKVTII